MLIWSLAAAFFLLGIRELLGGPEAGLAAVLGAAREEKAARRASALLHELQETLESGVVPTDSRWAELDGLPDPWGALAGESVRELRAQGGALLPTLRRLRSLADAHGESVRESRSRSSQAMAQSLACAGLVPLLGAALYAILPGVSARPWLWAAGCLGALALSGAGALWLLRLSERARWAGLGADDRPGVLAAQCAGERFLALLRGGTPPDLAWTRAVALLERLAPSLAASWGSSVWQGDLGIPFGRAPAALRLLVDAGVGIRRSIQVSLMEGRACGERVESALLGLRGDFRLAVQQELGLLGTRALQPLFVCVAPALLGLLALGVYLAWLEASVGLG